MKYKLGALAVTATVSNAMAENKQFEKDVRRALDMYVKADFSDMVHGDDVMMNLNAIESGDDRIFATYNTCKGKIYIITEWDRSYTTILLQKNIRRSYGKR